MASNTLLPVLALRDLGVAPATFAAIGTAGALAGIAGAAAASTITARIGLRTTRLTTAAAMILGVIAVMLTGVVADVLPGPPAAWLTVQAVLTGVGTAIAMVAGSDLAPRLIPAHALGTVMGAQRALVLGVMPVAALATGTLGAIAGTETAVWGWLFLSAAALIPCTTLNDPAPETTTQQPRPERRSA